MTAAKADQSAWVVDSSFACSLFLPDEKSEAASAFFEGILADEIHAPILLKYEIGNALRSASRRGRISDTEATELLSLFLELPIQYDELQNVNRPPAILEIARSTGLSVYDAAYLELSQLIGGSLLTLDADLRRAAKKGKVKTPTF